MRRLACGVALAALLGACTSAVPGGGTAARPAPDGPSAERPVYALGDRWIRSDGIYELIRIEGDTYVFAPDGRNELHLSRDLALVRHRSGGWSSLEFTPTPRLAWPLQVGKRGTATGQFRNHTGDVYDAALGWEVEAYEDVTVPAGTFKAFRIGFRVTPHGTVFGPPPRAGWTPPAVQAYRLWYAPAVRQYVRGDGDPWPVRFALVAVDPGETEPLTVLVQAPADNARFGPEADVTLTGKATGGKGVARVTVAVNGEVVATESPRADLRKTVLLDRRLPLRDGKNVILVTATDPEGRTSQQARTVVYSAPVPLPLPAPGDTPRVGHEYVMLRVPLPADGTVTAATVALNDVVVGSASPAHTPAGVFGTRLRLQEGENLVRIRYDTAAGAQRVEERTIVFEPAAAGAGRPGSTEAQQAQAPPPAAPRPVAVDPPVTASGRPGEPPRPVEAPPGAGAPRVEAQRPVPQAAARPPLQLTLASPRDQARFEHERIGLAGTVTSGTGVSRVTVALNGVEVSRQEERTPRRAVALSLPVVLRQGQNTLVVTATESDGTVSQEVRTVFFERAQPLTVAVRWPHDAARVGEPGTVAAAIVTSGKGVARVTVALNGAEVHRQAERTPPTSLLVTVPLTLRPGANVIAVSATDTAGAVGQEVRTVFLDTPAAVAAPPAPAPRHERWAVIIGVGRYDHPSIPRLRYTVSDAEAVHEALIGAAGFKKEHVLLLTDRSEKKPTLKNIKWALGTFLARSARKDDTVVIFFAGHGAPEVDQRGLERDGLAKYLIPSDAEADDLYSSALPMDELQTIFGRIEAERVVAFLDACYSGAAGGRTFSVRSTRAGSLDDLFLERLTRSKGRAIITASRPAEVSIELAELGHGIFTYYLVSGLRGAGDLNRDGIVSLQELYEYVEQQVTAKSRSVGGNQHPVMKGELEGVLPLARVRTP